MRKGVALFLVLATGVALSPACITWTKKDMRTLVEPPVENTAVLSVVKNSGKVVRFTKAEPGRIRGYAIVGTARDPLVKQVEIEGPFSQIKMSRDWTITEVTDGGGKAYSVKKVLNREANRMTILAAERERISIPLAEASVIEVQKHNGLAITAVLLGGLVVVPALAGILLYAFGPPIR